MKEHAVDLAKLSPPVGVSGLVVLGVSLSDWALVLTLIYTSICIFDKVFPGVLNRSAKRLWRKIKEVLHVPSK